MKTLAFTLIVSIFFPVFLSGNPLEDTISIDLGNNRRIVIYVNNQEDLKALQQYDINQMLKDLSNSLDSAGTDVDKLKIGDESGKRYLKDTIIEFIEVRAFFRDGDYVKEFSLGGFKRVEMSGNFQALIKKAGNYKIALSGNKNDVEKVDLDIEGEKMVANNSGNRGKVKVYVEMPELSGIELNGVARAQVLGFETPIFQGALSGASSLQAVIVADEADIEASGSSKIRMVGRGERLVAMASGASKIDASEFETITARVESSGASKAMINSRQADLHASGAATAKNKWPQPSQIRGEDEYFRIKIGKYEFSVDTKRWEDFEENFEDIESFDDLDDRIEESEYVQKEVPFAKHSVNFEFGMNNYFQNGEAQVSENSLYAVKPWGSWFVGAISMHRFHVGGPLFLDWGKGVSWYNFKFENPNVRALRGEQGVSFEVDQRGLSGVKSKITSSYLNMSLLPMIDFSRGLRRVKSYSMDGLSFAQYNRQGFRIGAGGYIGYRIGSHTKYVFRDDERHREKDRGSFFLNSWRYGIRGQMGYKGMEIFFNYDLSELYVGSESPELQPISFGIIF